MKYKSLARDFARTYGGWGKRGEDGFALINLKFYL